MKWIYRALAVVLILAGGIVFLAYRTALRSEQPVGFQMTRVTGVDGVSFPVGVWYPTESRAWPTAQIGAVLMEVARNAPVAGGGLPLVVVSHETVAARKVMPTWRSDWQVRVTWSRRRCMRATISLTKARPGRRASSALAIANSG